MNSRKKMLDLCLNQMKGFALDSSEYSDNRSLFSLIDKLLRSAAGESLSDCRKPLLAVVNLKVKSSKEKFMGCKLELLQYSIGALFGRKGDFLSEKIFNDGTNEYNRNMLLEYLEACRRIFVTHYVLPEKQNMRDEKKEEEPAPESEMGRLIRLAMEGGKKKQK